MKNEKQTYIRKPDWLKVRLGDSDTFGQTSRMVHHFGVHTICVSGKCPNQGECWSRGTATFMIGGDVCTRSCKFCNTKTGRPAALDPQEPEKLARIISEMKLKHAVITSVDRDDLPDLGASHWVRTIEAIREGNPDTSMEILIPDFQGRRELIDRVIDAGPDIISHNMETVRRLSPEIRSAASYETSLSVLAQVAARNKRTKSGLMLGLGETAAEVEQVIQDLYAVGCSILTLGQYLQPTRTHYPVRKYISPDEFNAFKEYALGIGFAHVESGAMVRSSYHAEKHMG